MFGQCCVQQLAPLAGEPAALQDSPASASSRGRLQPSDDEVEDESLDLEVIARPTKEADPLLEVAVQHEMADF